MRLNKFLSMAGVCSRRAAEELILSGVVRVNGKVAAITTPVNQGDSVTVDGKAAWIPNEEGFLETYIVNKPAGIICTLSDKERPNLKDLLPIKGHFFPIGRLDRDSEGLLLVTRDGELAQKLSHPSYGHEKEYLVWINKPITPELISALSAPIKLEEGTVKAKSVKKQGDNSFFIVLGEGRNRQIRRMCEHAGVRVEKLKRIRVGNLKLQLPVGEYRRLSKLEMEKLVNSGKKGKK
jgi:23S rRNA pseudouridine2604 synthase